jgi:hypothetical protein
MSDETMPTTKPCKICGEEIKLTATLCIHCKSYQDWRSPFGFSTTVLSLCVALVSVLTVALPVIKGVVIPANSALTWTVQGATQDTVYVLVSNRGSGPGSVAHGALYLDGTPSIILDLAQDLPTVRVIEAGKSELIEYRVRRVLEGVQIKEPESYKSCELYMRLTDFRGSVWWGHFNADCVQFTAFLKKQRKSDAGTQSP